MDDVAPRDGDGGGREILGERDGFNLVRRRDLDDPAVLANPAALGQAFDHGLGGAGTEFAVTRFEGELEMGRRRQLAFQHGRQAIGGHDVEADAGNGDDAGVPDFLAARVDVFEHRDFAGDVEIVRSGAQARGEHRPAGGGERTRAVQHRCDAFKVRRGNRRVGEIEHARFDSPVRARAAGCVRRGGRPEPD